MNVVSIIAIISVVYLVSLYVLMIKMHKDVEHWCKLERELLNRIMAVDYTTYVQGTQLMSTEYEEPDEPPYDILSDESIAGTVQDHKTD